jgi:HD-like signal output (HDOD) protein
MPATTDTAASAPLHATAQATPPAPSPLDPTDVADPITQFNVQTAATRWVFSLPPNPATPAPAHGLTLASLADAIERMSLDTTRAADWVPRVPAVLPGLLRSLRNEHSSAHDLAHLIEQDVSLLAEALKEANSALYQRGEKVNQTEDAVRLLGNQGLRMLIARVAFRPVLGADAGPLVQAGAAHTWALGEACAQASRALAPARGVDPFEAFLSGLALNIGQLVALRMADRVAHLARQDAHGLGPRKVPVGERADTTSDNQAAQDVAHVVALLSHRVAARWELPDNVVGTLTAQIDPMARFQWPQAGELLSVAQEAARLKVLDEAGWLPAPLTDCWHHLPEDARHWLQQTRQAPNAETADSADN